VKTAAGSEDGTPDNSIHGPFESNEYARFSVSESASDVEMRNATAPSASGIVSASDWFTVIVGREFTTNFTLTDELSLSASRARKVKLRNAPSWR
jgi:hypothetical protein